MRGFALFLFFSRNILATVGSAVLPLHVDGDQFGHELAPQPCARGCLKHRVLLTT